MAVLSAFDELCFCFGEPRSALSEFLRHISKRQPPAVFRSLNRKIKHTARHDAAGISHSALKSSFGQSRQEPLIPFKHHIEPPPRPRRQFWRSKKRTLLFSTPIAYGLLSDRTAKSLSRCGNTVYPVTTRNHKTKWIPLYLYRIRTSFSRAL